MKLHSIYEHMEHGAEKIPLGSNSKIVFRHSIRREITSGVGCNVTLTNEGIELARNFGRYLDTEIGFVASSSCKRNIQTCEEILNGNGCKRDIVLAHNQLEVPQTKNKSLSDEIFEKYAYQNTEILFLLKNEGLPGFNSINMATKIMLDFIFSNGNKEKTVDLFCTHDFQMAILYAGLFDFASTRENMEKNWPMMLEGMIFYGTRNHFWCSWRNETREYSDFLMNL